MVSDTSGIGSGKKQPKKRNYGLKITKPQGGKRYKGLTKAEAAKQAADLKAVADAFDTTRVDELRAPYSLARSRLIPEDVPHGTFRIKGEDAAILDAIQNEFKKKARVLLKKGLEYLADFAFKRDQRIYAFRSLSRLTYEDTNPANIKGGYQAGDYYSAELVGMEQCKGYKLKVHKKYCRHPPRKFTAKDAGRIICYARRDGATIAEIKEAAGACLGAGNECEKEKERIEQLEKALATQAAALEAAISSAASLETAVATMVELALTFAIPETALIGILAKAAQFLRGFVYGRKAQNILENTPLLIEHIKSVDTNARNTILQLEHLAGSTLGDLLAKAKVAV